jgi:hypothetical protein
MLTNKEILYYCDESLKWIDKKATIESTTNNDFTEYPSKQHTYGNGELYSTLVNENESMTIENMQKKSISDDMLFKVEGGTDKELLCVNKIEPKKGFFPLSINKQNDYIFSSSTYPNQLKEKDSEDSTMDITVEISKFETSMPSKDELEKIWAYAKIISMDNYLILYMKNAIDVSEGLPEFVSVVEKRSEYYINWEFYLKKAAIAEEYLEFCEKYNKSEYVVKKKMYSDDTFQKMLTFFGKEVESNHKELIAILELRTDMVHYF